MTYDEYKEQALTTATYPEGSLGKSYLKLGLRGESGEVCDKFKKLIRDDGWNFDMPVPEDKRLPILLELGDVLWYCACYSHETGFNMSFDDNGEIEIYKLVYTLEESLIDLSRAASENDIRGAVICAGVIAQYLGSNLNEVARLNSEKLASRKKRNKLGGSGDYR